MYEDLEPGMLLWVEITRACPPCVQFLNEGELPELDLQAENYRIEEWNSVQCAEVLGNQNTGMHLTRDMVDIVYRSHAVTQLINRFLVDQGVALNIRYASSMDGSHHLTLSEDHFDRPESLLAIEKELEQHFYLVYQVQEA